MHEYSGFWAGALRYGRGIDLRETAARAGGWRAWEEAPRAAWREFGVPSERVEGWYRSEPRTSRGQPITLADPCYPAMLAALPCPPPILFVEGVVSALARRSVAVVGTRACTAYGASIARRLGVTLAEAGFAVVSGLARGIDTHAHTGTLGVGVTVAVVAHGLDYTAPPSNRGLRQKILDGGGAIVSTCPDGYEPRPYMFPQRNAWISGLCSDVVVVEAPRKSGALGTARAAVDQGREVWAVPGPLGAPASLGCLDLIQEGARVLADWHEFMAVMGVVDRPLPGPWLGPLFAGATVDEVAEKVGRSASSLLADLATFEASGSVVRLSGQRYAPSGSGR